MIYSVTVRNEQTSELAVLDVEAGDAVDAQCQALLMVFSGKGWRKATALVPEGAEGSGWETDWQRFVDRAADVMRRQWLPVV